MLSIVTNLVAVSVAFLLYCASVAMESAGPSMAMKLPGASLPSLSSLISCNVSLLCFVSVLSSSHYYSTERTRAIVPG